jgi:hypothetical protein
MAFIRIVSMRSGSIVVVACSSAITCPSRAKAVSDVLQPNAALNATLNVSPAD